MNESLAVCLILFFFVVGFLVVGVDVVIWATCCELRLALLGGKHIVSMLAKACSQAVCDLGKSRRARVAYLSG